MDIQIQRQILSTKFFRRFAADVASELLGKVLVRKINEQILSGIIVETEAYLAENDLAAHAVRGKTEATKSLYLDAGHAYVHRMHRQNCLDVVVEKENVPSGVLIRALEPLEGVELMKKLRKKEELTDLSSGPGKLCQALGITKELDGVNLTSKDRLWIEDRNLKIGKISKSHRIGIFKSTELELRFYVSDSKFVSKTRKLPLK